MPLCTYLTSSIKVSMVRLDWRWWGWSGSRLGYSPTSTNRTYSRTRPARGSGAVGCNGRAGGAFSTWSSWKNNTMLFIQEYIFSTFFNVKVFGRHCRFCSHVFECNVMVHESKILFTDMLYYTKAKSSSQRNLPKVNFDKSGFSRMQQRSKCWDNKMVQLQIA